MNRWNEIPLETRNKLISMYKNNRQFKQTEEWAEELDMNPKTLVRRLQENLGSVPEYSGTGEVFPDKKSSHISFQSVLDQIKKVQLFKDKKSVSQDEASWNPRSEYPELPIAITWMCDVHFGSLETDYELLEDHLNIIRETPNMYVIFGGDEIDNFNGVKYPAGIWSDGVSPEDQMLAWANLLEQLDDESKVAAIVWGNHTQFSALAGIDPYSTFFRDVSCPLFADGGGVLNVLFKGTKYRLGIRHTFWGGSKLNVTNSAKRMIQFGYPNLDVAMLGHVHDAAGEMFTLEGQEKIAVVGGTYKLMDSFRKRWNGNPQEAGFTVILHPGTKRMQLCRTPQDAQDIILGHIERFG